MPRTVSITIVKEDIFKEQRPNREKKMVDSESDMLLLRRADKSSHMADLSDAPCGADLTFFHSLVRESFSMYSCLYRIYLC